MTMKTQQPKTMGRSKSSSKREVYSNTILPQLTGKKRKKHKHMEAKQYVTK